MKAEITKDKIDAMAQLSELFKLMGENTRIKICVEFDDSPSEETRAILEKFSASAFPIFDGNREVDLDCLSELDSASFCERANAAVTDLRLLHRLMNEGEFPLQSNSLPKPIQ